MLTCRNATICTELVGTNRCVSMRFDIQSIFEGARGLWDGSGEALGGSKTSPGRVLEASWMFLGGLQEP